MSVSLRIRKPRYCLLLLGVAAATTLSSFPAWGNSQSPQSEDAVRAVISDPSHQDAPGCIAGSFAHGRPTSIVAQGYADLDARRMIDSDTQFYAASISKQFTALAAATLIVDGKLSLDDDVRRYLPELPAYRAPVTVGMLMHHSSGIRDSLGLLRMTGMDNVGQASKEEALQLLFRQNDTSLVPGTAYRYSNGGYLLLAEIVERVSGMAFADYANQAIFKPLGMRSAYFLNGGAPRPGAFAHGYVPEGSGFAMRDTFPRFSGSGGLMISMNDFARYVDDIDRVHRVWTPEIAKILLTPGRYTDGSPVEDGAGLGYGGGLHLGERGGERIVQHTGSAEAFKHAFLRFPDRGEIFVVFCNRGDWTASEKLKRIVVASGSSYPGMPRIQPTGLFHSDELDADYRLKPEGDGLRADISSSISKSTTTLHFVPKDDGRFHAGTMTVTPTDDASRILVKRGDIGELLFTRVGEGGAN